jgi:hypothetical protein
MRWLLDYAAPQAGAGIGAWRRDTEHVEKAFLFGAMGARNGVNAALVVHQGWSGVNDILSGPNNFVETYNYAIRPGIQRHHLYGNASEPSREARDTCEPHGPVRCGFQP